MPRSASCTGGSTRCGTSHAGGQVIVSSGYGVVFTMPGNAPLVFEAK
jgi:hypothetical protein